MKGNKLLEKKLGQVPAFESQVTTKKMQRQDEKAALMLDLEHKTAVSEKEINMMRRPASGECEAPDFPKKGWW